MTPPTANDTVVILFIFIFVSDGINSVADYNSTPGAVVVVVVVSAKFQNGITF